MHDSMARIARDRRPRRRRPACRRAAQAAGRPGARRGGRDGRRRVRRCRQRRRAPARPRRRQRDAGHGRASSSGSASGNGRASAASTGCSCAAAPSRCTCTCWSRCGASATPRRRRTATCWCRRPSPKASAWSGSTSTASTPARSLPVVLGRSPQATYCIDDTAVSRSHARIDWHGGTFQLIDLSYNGTYVRFDNDPEIISLRRGTCTLHGSGVIGLGTPPSESMSPCVRFEIMKFADTQRGQSPVRVRPEVTATGRAGARARHGSAHRASSSATWARPTRRRPPAVRRYLAEFLSDPRVVEIPRAALVADPARRRSCARGRRARPRKYATIWTPEGSPLAVWTTKQAGAARRLSRRARPSACSCATRCATASRRSPRVLDELKAAGADRVLVLPLYPQYSAATTGQHRRRGRPPGCARTPRRARDALRQALPRRRRLHHGAGPPRRAHWMTHGRPDKLVLSFHGMPRAHARLSATPTTANAARPAACSAERLEAARRVRRRHIPEPLRHAPSG